MLKEPDSDKLSGKKNKTTAAKNSRFIKLLKIGLYFFLFAFVGYLVVLFLALNDVSDRTRSIAAYDRIQRSKEGAKLVISGENLHEKSKYDPDQTKIDRTNKQIKDSFGSSHIKLDKTPDVGVSDDGVTIRSTRTKFMGETVDMDGDLSYNKNGANLKLNMKNKDGTLLSQTVAKKNPGADLGSLEEDQGVSSSALSFSSQNGLHADSDVEAYNNKALSSLFDMDPSADRDENFIPKTVCNTVENITLYKNFKAKLKGEIKNNKLPKLEIINLPDICIETSIFKNNRVEIALVPGSTRKYSYKFQTRAVIKELSVDFPEKGIQMGGYLETSKKATIQMSGPLSKFKFGADSKLNEFLKLKNCSLNLIIAPAKTAQFTGSANCEIQNLYMFEGGENINVGHNQAEIDITDLLKDNRRGYITVKTDGTFNIEEKITLRNVNFRFMTIQGKVITLIQSSFEFNFGHSNAWRVRCKGIGKSTSENSFLMNADCGSLHWSELDTSLEDIKFEYNKGKDTRLIAGLKIFGRQLDVDQRIKDIKKLSIEIPFDFNNLKTIFNSPGAKNDVLREFIGLQEIKNKLLNLKVGYLDFSKQVPALKFPVLDTLKYKKLIMKNVKLLYFGYKKEDIINMRFVLKNSSLNDVLISTLDNKLGLLGMKKIKYYNARFDRIILTIGTFISRAIDSVNDNHGLNFKTNGVRFSITTELHRLLGSKTGFEELDNLVIKNRIIANFDLKTITNDLTYEGDINLGKIITLSEVQFSIENGKVAIKKALLEINKDETTLNLNMLNNKMTKIELEGDKILLSIAEKIEMGGVSLSGVKLILKKEGGKYTYTMEGLKTFITKNILRSVPMSLSYPNNSGVDYETEFSSLKDTEVADFKKLCPAAIEINRDIHFGKLTVNIEYLHLAAGCVSILTKLNLFGKNYELRLQKANITKEEKEESFLILKGSIYAKGSIFDKPLNLELNLPVNHETGEIGVPFELIKIKLDAELTIFGGTISAHIDNLTDSTKQCEIRVHNIPIKGGFLLIKDIVIQYNQEHQNFTADMNIKLKNHFEASLQGNFQTESKSWNLKGYVKNPLPNLPKTETDLFKLTIKSEPLFIALESNFNFKNFKAKGMLVYDQSKNSFDVSFPIIQLGPYVRLSELVMNNNNPSQDQYKGKLSLGECSKEKNSVFCLNSLSVDVKKTDTDLEVETKLDSLAINTPFGLGIEMRDIEIQVKKYLEKSHAKLEEDSSMLLNFNDAKDVPSHKDYDVHLSGTGSVKLKGGKEFLLQTKLDLHDDMVLELSARNTTLAFVELLQALGVPGLDKLRKYLNNDVSSFNIKITKTNGIFEILVKESGDISKNNHLFVYFSPNTGKYIVSYVKTKATTLSELFPINSDITIQNLKIQVTNCAATNDCSSNQNTNEDIKKLEILENNFLILEGEISFSSLTSNVKDLQPVLNLGAKPISEVKVSSKIDIIHPEDSFILKAELDNIKIGKSVDLSLNLDLQVKDKELFIHANSSIIIAKNKYLEAATIAMEFTYDQDKVVFYVKGGSPGSKNEENPQDVTIKYNDVSLLTLEDIDIEIKFNKHTNKLEQSHFYGKIKIPKANKEIKAMVELLKPEKVNVNGIERDQVTELTINLDVSDLSVEDTIKYFGDKTSMPDLNLLENKITEKGDMKKALRNVVGSVQIKVRTQPETFVLVDIKSSKINSGGVMIDFDFVMVIESIEGNKNVSVMFKIDGKSNLVDLEALKTKNQKLKDMVMFKGLFLLSYYSDISSIKRLSHKLDTENIIEENCNFDFYKKQTESSSLPSLNETDGSLFLCFDAEVGKMTDVLDFDIDVVFVGYLNKKQLIISGALNYVKFTNKKRGIDLKIEKASLLIEKTFNRTGIVVKAGIEGSVKFSNGKQYADFKGYIDLVDNSLLTEIEVNGSINILGDFYLNNARLYMTLEQEDKNDYIRLEGMTEIKTLPSSFAPVSKVAAVKKGYFDILLYLDLNQLNTGITNIKDVGVLLFLKAENFNFGSLLPKGDNLVNTYVHKALSKIQIGKVSFILNTLPEVNHSDDPDFDPFEDESETDRADKDYGLITEQNFKKLDSLKVKSEISKFPKGITFNLEDIRFFNFRGLARFRHHNELVEVYCVIYPLEIKLGKIPILTIRGLNEKFPNFELVLKRNKGVSFIRVKGGVFVFGVIGGAGTIIRDDVKEKGVWNIEGEIKLLVNYQLTMKITGDNLLKPKKIGMRMFAGPASFAQVFIDIEEKINTGQQELENSLNSSMSIESIEDAYLAALKSLYKKKDDKVMELYRRQNISDKDLQDYIKLNIDIDEDQHKEEIMDKELDIMEKKKEEDEDMFKSVEAKIEEMKKQISDNQKKIKSRWSWSKRFRLKTKSIFKFDIKKAFNREIIKLNIKIAAAWVKYIMKKIGHYTMKYLGKPLLILAKWIIRALSLGQAIISVQSMEALVEDVDGDKEMQVAKVTLVTVVGPDEIKVHQEMNVGHLTSYWTLVSTLIVLIIKVVIQLGKDLFKVFKKFAALVGA